MLGRTFDVEPVAGVELIAVGEVRHFVDGILFDHMPVAVNENDLGEVRHIAKLVGLEATDQVAGGFWVVDNLFVDHNKDKSVATIGTFGVLHFAIVRPNATDAASRPSSI